MARLLKSRAVAAWLSMMLINAAACSSTPDPTVDPTDTGNETGTAETSVPPDTSGDTIPCTFSSDGCKPPDTGVDATDTNVPDTDVPETLFEETGTTDAGDSAPPDTNPPDVIIPDTSLPDATPVDTSAPDSGADTMDSTIVDSTPTDTGSTADTSGADTGVDATDSTVTDTGSPDSGSTDTGSPDTGTVDSGPPRSFSCSSTSWKQNMPFDSFKVKSSTGSYSVQGVTLWGSNPSNVYAGVTSNGGINGMHGDVARWNGSTWTQETVDTSPTTVDDPLAIDALWGTSDTDLWAPARGYAQGILYHRTAGGVWTKDSTAPYAKEFGAIWGNGSSDLFMVGWKTGKSLIWRKSGSSWIEQTLPAPKLSYPIRALGRSIWGFDSSHVYVVGYYMDTVGSSLMQVAGFVMAFDGSSWTEIAAPSECVEARAIHGTSSNDLFVSCLVKQTTGSTTSYVGGVYHITSAMSSWTSYINKDAGNYGAVWSKYPGTVLASGHYTLDTSTHLTTMDQLSTPTTYAFGSPTYGDAAIWVDPSVGSTAVWIGYSSAGGSSTAGIMTGSCD